MSSSSRRTFLATTGAAAGATLLAAGVAQARPTATDADSPDSVELESTSDSMLIAIVTGPSSGQVTIINGATETTVVDRALADRIAHHSRTEH